VFDVGGFNDAVTLVALAAGFVALKFGDQILVFFESSLLILDDPLAVLHLLGNGTSFFLEFGFFLSRFRENPTASVLLLFKNLDLGRQSLNLVLGLLIRNECGPGVGGLKLFGFVFDLLHEVLRLLQLGSLPVLFLL
jgi:hypothetical protein